MSWFPMQALAEGDAAAPAELATIPVGTREASVDRAAEAGATLLDTIVVTATRRERQLRNVPISVFAITGEQLGEMGAAKFRDYAGMVAGLSSSSFAGFADGDKFVLRGISSDGVASEIRPLTAVYFDETPVTLANGGNLLVYSPDPELIDIERIEVLRGPQGTLFGAHAMGGAIRILPKSPDPLRTEGSIGAELKSIRDGGTGRGAHAIGNLALAGGRAALRAVAFYRTAEGYIDRVDDNAHADINTDRAQGFRLAGLYEFSDALTVSGKLAFQDRHSDGNARESPGLPQDQQDHHGVAEPNNDRWTLYNLVLDHAGDTLRTVSSTSWRKRYADFQLDATRSATALIGPLGDPAWLYVQDGLPHELTQEIRIQSNGDGALEWLAGLYYQDQAYSAFGVLPAPNYDAATAPLPGTPATAGGLGQYVARNDVRQYAVFADLSWRLAQAWELGAGARVYRVDQDGYAKLDGLILSVAGTNAAPTTGTARETGVTPRFTVQYLPNEHLSFYANAGKGFRPGGINPPPPQTPDCQQDLNDAGYDAVPPTFTSDTLWSYELGARGSWFGGLLNASAAVFHIDWKDLQQLAGLCQEGLYSFYDNLGRARSDGVELDIVAAPVPRLQIEFHGGYADARYAADRPGASGARATLLDAIDTRNPQDRPERGVKKGQPLNDVPRYTFAIAATYGLPHAGSFLRLDYQFRKGAVSGLTFSEALEPLPDTGVANARLVWSFGRLQAGLTVRNLLNDRTETVRHQDTDGRMLAIVRLPPRTVEVGFEYPF